MSHPIESLDVAKMERSAAANLEIAKRTKELQALVSREFPGFHVFISRLEVSLDRNGVHRNGNGFAHLSGVEQVEQILRETRVAIKKQALLAAIQDRGGHMNMATLTSYLSRYPKFVKQGHGIWGIKKDINDEPLFS
jgi:hypothetical protein